MGVRFYFRSPDFIRLIYGAAALMENIEVGNSQISLLTPGGWET